MMVEAVGVVGVGGVVGVCFRAQQTRRWLWWRTTPRTMDSMWGGVGGVGIGVERMVGGMGREG